MLQYLTLSILGRHMSLEDLIHKPFKKMIDPDFKILYQNIRSAKMYTLHVFSIICLNLPSAVETSSKKRMQRKVLGRTTLFFRL